MKPTLFTYRIKPGKLQTYLDFIETCTAGEHQEQYKELLLRYGLNTVTMWHHTIGGHDYAMFMHKMDDDGAEKLSTWNQHGHPFDQWFNDSLAECYADSTEQQPIFVRDFDAKG